MKEILDPVIRSAEELSSAAKRVTNHGVSFFRSKLGGVPIFASVIAGEAGNEIEYDATHYFLVPYRIADAGYALYTQRVLPEGVGPENALPKTNIFHLPAEGTTEALEKLLVANLTESHRAKITPDTVLAERLDLIAEEIDKQSNVVTGGLILVGGVVSIVNPLLGVGIAAKAILPTLGTKLSKHGLNHVSGWLRDRKEQNADKTASRDAQKSVKRISPLIEIDETLALLERTVSTSDGNHDPNMKFATMMSRPDGALKTRHACQAIACVYREQLDAASFPEESCLNPAAVEWLDSIAKIAGTGQN